MKKHLWIIVVVIVSSVAMSFAQTTKPARGKAQEKEETYTRVYDIRDLLLSIRDFPFIGTMGMPEESARIVAMPDEQPASTRPAPAREQLVKDVIALITETVDPDSWRDAGGITGSIRELSGQLIITQSASAHNMIFSLFSQLRETNGTVRVRADWVMLSPEVLQTLLVNPPPDPANPNNPVGAAPKVVDRALLAKLPANTVHYQGEITCFSGQKISLSSGRGRTVVYEGDPVVAQGAAAMSARVRQVQTGAMLEITPLVITNTGSGIIELRSKVVEWGEPTSVALAFPSTAPSSPKISVAGAASITQLNLVNQELKGTLRVPINQPILVGGMTFEPKLNEPAGGQLYLIIEISPAR
jgi:hypothetical protein